MRKWLASIVILALSFVAIGHARAAAALDPEAGHRHRQDRSRAMARFLDGGLESTMSRSQPPD